MNGNAMYKKGCELTFTIAFSILYGKNLLFTRFNIKATTRLAQDFKSILDNLTCSKTFPTS